MNVLVINCGSSSIEVERINRPIFVNRSASDNKFPSASLSSVIVLNFINRKTVPFLPGRFWKKNEPPPLFTKCKPITVTKNIGEIRSRKKKARIKSRNRLKKQRYILKSNDSIKKLHIFICGHF